MAVSWLSRLKPKRHLLGLDIGKSAIKVVQLATTRNGISLRYAGLTERAPAESGDGGGGATLAVNEAIRESGLKRQAVAIQYSGAGPVIRYLQFPKMPKDELGEAVRWEAKKILPQPIEEMVLDYLILGETQERDLKRIEILLVAADRAAVLDQLESLKPVHLPVTVMDVNPLALFNALKLNYRSDLEENLVFVDIGAGKMDINIGKRGMLRFTRNIQLGGDAITQAVMGALQVEGQEAERLKRHKGLSAPAGGEAPAGSEAEKDRRMYDAVKVEVDRMILETQRSIDYYRAQFREGGVKKIVLMGGVGLMPGFQEYFASYFDANVEMDDPFAEIACDEVSVADLRLLAPRFSTSVGLALRRTGE